jgi:hypothetical protein
MKFVMSCSTYTIVNSGLRIGTLRRNHRGKCLGGVSTRRRRACGIVVGLTGHFGGCSLAIGTVRRKAVKRFLDEMRAAGEIFCTSSVRTEPCEILAVRLAAEASAP